MPLYTFLNKKTGKTQDFYFAMKEAPKVGDIFTDEESREWVRIFTLPNAGIHTKVDPFSKSEFLRSTENKKGTLGDMYDHSQALSQARADKNGGVDPVKETFYKKWSKERGGKAHPQQQKEKMTKKLAEKGIELV